jgi:hypothetical protein
MPTLSIINDQSFIEDVIIILARKFVEFSIIAMSLSKKYSIGSEFCLGRRTDNRVKKYVEKCLEVLTKVKKSLPKPVIWIGEKINEKAKIS